ncbi:MAG: hypothetical protein ACI3VZ_01155 [Faecousia sp.]
MERGIYFDGWHHNNHCYHPTLPYRNMQMVEDLEKYKATILVWSVMGGGSISLPYLENEAFGEVDPKLRFYGFMNDSEFIAECNKRGIKTMGIVFEVQGWEFPVEVSEDGKHIKQFNVIREGNPTDYYGLNEFSNGKFDGLFRTSLKDYYPNGIINSDGEVVTNLQEEVAARTWRGEPVHAGWVEVVNHSKTCYQTCRNNPVWRDYLKKIMALQIDAGVAGIQLDEAELPITSMGAGGCFCKDCKKQFREYLKERRKAHTLNESLYAGIDLETFDYQQYVLDGGYDHPNDSPLMRDYYEFQMRAVKKHFTELVDFARDYARRTQNREIWLSGNFFTCMPVYYPFENTVDVVITEMDHTLFRQPHWYRYISGFSNTKPVVVAENPYGGIVPQLVEQLNRGKGYDLYRLLQLEASVYGCNMSVPYGGWMGNTIKTGFWPPRDVTEQIQTFLADHDELYSKESGAKILVPYSFPSYYWREVTKKGGGDQFTDVNSSILYYTSLDQESEDASRLPFWDVSKYLSEQQVIYDVRMFGDDDLRPDPVSAEDWKQYELIILPECDYLTDNQCRELERYVLAGGKLMLFGRTAENHPGWAEKMAAYPGVTLVSNPDSRREAMKMFDMAFAPINAGIAQAVLHGKNPGDLRNVGIHFHKNGEKSSIHLLNYQYNAASDRVETIPGLVVEARVEEDVTGAVVYDLDSRVLDAEVRVRDGKLTVKLDLPIYAVIELKK